VLQDGRSQVRVPMRFLNGIILQAALDPGVYSASNSTRNRKKIFLQSKERPVRKAESLTAICEAIV
jgi:hypothetical protein